MKFLQAKKGIQYLYHEAIVSMVFALVCLIETLCSVFDASEPILIIVSILVYIALALTLAGLILQILGILKAALDEPIFIKALYIIIICAIFEIIGAILEKLLGSEDSIIYIINAIGDFSRIFVMTYVIKGIYSIFNKLGKIDIVKNANKMCTWIIISLSLALLLNIIPLFGTNEKEIVNYIHVACGVISDVIEFAVSLNFLLFFRIIIQNFDTNDKSIESNQ